MSVEALDSQRVEGEIDSPSEPVNILLVDDEESNLRALEAVLAADDRRLMRAQSGEDALRWLLKERFAVILLDVFMPGMDGFQTAELIRQHVRSQSTPIIFLTAASKDSTQISRGYALGAVDYILKPLDVSILRAKVDVFVDLFRKTEQVRRQAELLTEARSFLQNVLESTTDYAIIALDLAGVVMAWYEGARRLYGYLAEEVIGSLRVDSLFCPDEVRSGRMQTLFDAASSTGRAEDVFEHVRRDGERFTASVSVNPRRDADGNAIGHVLVVKDITQQRLQEERARLLIREQAARAEAQDAVTAREEFLSVASHELRTPITSLRGQAQLMIRQLETKGMPDQERLLRAFRVIDVQSDRLTRLLSQLLDVSRLQAGKLEIEPTRADLRSVVQEVVTRIQAATTTHSIELRSPGELVGHFDPLRLEQVVNNLLDNAVKYSPEGGRVEVELSRTGANELRLAVRDWGEGIPPEHRTHIFDRFHQAPGRYRSSGMGLGLYISRQIVELHGGRIEAEFPSDGGTRFVVTLPSGSDAAVETSG